MQVIRKNIVAQSLARLRNQKTHTLFAGYLYLQQKSFQLGRLNDLHPEFVPFFEQFFHVENHPLGTPYIKPFTEQKASSKNLWLNKNVAGSYAPSSLRPDQPFRQVVLIDGKNYSLPADHCERAFVHLLYSEPIEVADLAVFLYRDFGLDNKLATIHDLINIFAYEFGYLSKQRALTNKNFDKLYSLKTARDWKEDWLQPDD